jgi:hypothetical protein
VTDARAGGEVSESSPALSVVVTIVDGGEVLRRFLEALYAQEGAPELYVIVHYDDTIVETGELSPLFPRALFISLGQVATFRPIESVAGQHELYDRRRAAGLKRATGRLLALLEDRAPPRKDWARTMIRLHDELPHGTIGGAVESVATDRLNWAFYVCDFSRYTLPFQAEPRTWISDVHVCYKRRIIEETRDIWRERFNEASVHWTLLERGETLYLSPELVVDYRTPYTKFGSLLGERFHWGRLFGYARARHVGAAKRLVYTVTGPIIPFWLLVRHGATMAGKGQGGRFLAAAPIIFMLLSAWTSGEVWGYITNRP